MKTRLTLILSVVLLWPNISLSNQEILDDEFKLDAISTGRKVFFETEKEPQLFFVNSETSSTPSFKLSYSSSYSHTVQGFYQSYQSKSSPLLIPRPDSYETVLNFAMMSSNAYVLQSVLREWRNMTGWDKEESFGWDGTGLRGYIFANSNKSIVVISFKGTSTLFGGGDTVSEDKYMDNLMFSCCCARVDISWTPVCGCYLGSQRCNQTCLDESVKSSEVSYYEEALSITNEVIKKYKGAQLWFTGHSLGGAIAALMTVTFQRTASITWEAPGASLYAQRLGLHSNNPKETSRFPIWNFGISTDPIFLGTCSGITSGCYLSGYAMETKCRQGQDCLFNLPSRLVNINTHRIEWVIENVLLKPDKFPLPACAPALNCTECEDWKFLTKLEDKEEL